MEILGVVYLGSSCFLGEGAVRVPAFKTGFFVNISIEEGR